MTAPDNQARIVRMRELLQSALQPTLLEIDDDSHRHVGHAGARDGRGHFSLRIASESFRGRAPLACHRLVYVALGEMMQTDIHALSIRATVPAE